MHYLPIATRYLRTATLCAFTMVSAHVHAAAFQNGSFELGSVSGGGATNGWTLTNTFAIDVEGATDGAFAITFNTGGRPADGVASQTFDTVASVLYTVEFDFGGYSPNFGNSDNQRLRVQVLDGTPPLTGPETINPGSGTVNTVKGATILQYAPFIVSDTTIGGAGIYAAAPNTEFSTFSFTFTALSASSTIFFSDASVTGFSQSDGILDNVRIVPEPSALVSLILGATGLLALRRRR